MDLAAESEYSVAQCIMKHLDPDTFIRSFLKHGLRPDGRKFTDQRSISITKGVVKSSGCFGSSAVKVGATSVVCGITLLKGTPHQDAPENGDIVFDVSLWPLCSRKYDSRSKSDAAYQIEHLLSEIFNSNAVTDLKALYIIKGRAAFRIVVNLVFQSDAGNLQDTAIIATVAALQNLSLPGHIVKEDSTIEFSSLDLKPIAILRQILVPVTCSLFDESVLVDPTSEEEDLQRGTLTTVFDATGNLVHMHQYSRQNLWTCARLLAAIELCEQSRLPRMSVIM